MGKTSKRAARLAMERRMESAATPRTATGPPKVQLRVSGDLKADAAAAQGRWRRRRRTTIVKGGVRTELM